MSKTTTGLFCLVCFFSELLKLIFAVEVNRDLSPSLKCLIKLSYLWSHLWLLTWGDRFVLPLLNRVSKTASHCFQVLDWQYQRDWGIESKNAFRSFRCITLRMWWRGNDGSVGMATEHWDTTETLCDNRFSPTVVGNFVRHFVAIVKIFFFTECSVSVLCKWHATQLKPTFSAMQSSWAGDLHWHSVYGTWFDYFLVQTEV